MSRFGYLIAKIEQAPIETEPFRHIYIKDLLTQADFNDLTSLPEIKIDPATDDSDLFGKLFASGYKVIDFPGCIVDQQKYLDWHRTKERSAYINSACEGFGMTLRLIDARSPLLAELTEFLASTAFNQAIASRFGLDLKKCKTDGGIQKYLDGYEISPHPDTRRKAATFMVNINPHHDSEATEHHTHYLKFKPEYQYVQKFWEQRNDVDRCWVPWDWCDTKLMQRPNNSMVIFSPADNTMHGVKADYDHLQGQRTQLYGNLWFKEMPAMQNLDWEGLAGGSLDAIDIPVAAKNVAPPLLRQVKQAVKGILKSQPKKTDEPENYYRRS